MNVDEIQNELNKYGKLIIGITIDRGDGDEYFEIINVKYNAVNNVWLELEGEDYIDAQWLSNCDEIKFHLNGQAIIKENPKYIVELREDDIRSIVKTLMATYDRLIETSNTNSKSVVANVEDLPDKINTLKYRLVQVVNNADNLD